MDDLPRNLALALLEADDRPTLQALRGMAREAAEPPPESGLGDPDAPHVKEAAGRVRALMLAHVRGRAATPDAPFALPPHFTGWAPPDAAGRRYYYEDGHRVEGRRGEEHPREQVGRLNLHAAGEARRYYEQALQRWPRDAKQRRAYLRERYASLVRAYRQAAQSELSRHVPAALTRLHEVTGLPAETFRPLEAGLPSLAKALAGEFRERLAGALRDTGRRQPEDRDDLFRGLDHAPRMDRDSVADAFEEQTGRVVEDFQARRYEELAGGDDDERDRVGGRVHDDGEKLEEAIRAVLGSTFNPWTKREAGFAAFTEHAPKGGQGQYKGGQFVPGDGVADPVNVDPAVLRWAGGPDGFIDGGRTYRVYHGTTQEKAAQVQADGLRPPPGTEGRARYFMLTTSPEEARTFAGGQSNQDGRDWAVIEYRFPAAELKRLLWKGHRVTAGDIQHAVRDVIPGNYVHAVHTPDAPFALPPGYTGPLVDAAGRHYEFVQGKRVRRGDRPAALYERESLRLRLRGAVARAVRGALRSPGDTWQRTRRAARAALEAYGAGGARAVGRDAVRAAAGKALRQFKRAEKRYGRRAAVALAFGYLSLYAGYALEPTLMLYVPSPVGALLGVAEAVRALARGARKAVSRATGLGSVGFGAPLPPHYTGWAEPDSLGRRYYYVDGKRVPGKVHEGPGEPHAPPKSTARAVITGTPAAQAKAEKLVPKVLGKGFDPAHLASLVGAPEGAQVLVYPGDDRKSLSVVMQGEGYYAERTVRRMGSGELVVVNEKVRLADRLQGNGFGSELFARQVDACRAHGVGSIRCHAAKGPAWNGYYTWPRLGYDQDLEDLEDSGERIAARKIRETFPGANSILDVMATKEGRDWWKANGVDLFRAKFDLTEGSRSLQIHDAYMAERAGRAKV